MGAGDITTQLSELINSLQGTKLGEDDIESVKKTWELMKATIADAESLEIPREAEQLWLRQLRYLAYEVEDLLDLHEYQILAKKAEKNGKESSHEEIRKEILDGMQKIRRRFDVIAQEKTALSLSSNGNIDGSRVYGPIATSHYPPRNSTFVGRQAEKESLLNMLLADGGDDPFEVIGVVGMGGIGKTALCQQIYHHSDITTHFPLMGWMYVGDSNSPLDPAKLTLDILQCFLPLENIAGTQLSILQDKLTDYLKQEKMRFLLVLDDTWCKCTREWESFLAPFGCSTSGSKMLVTTCNEEVTQSIKTSNLIRLRCLSEEDARQLFTEYAGIRDGDRATAVSDISKKCGGLPLAIKNMGNHLRWSREWSEDGLSAIMASDLWNCGLSEGGREIFGPLYLSYLKLPSHLKACFKFCSLLKKDKEYETRMLTEMWTAHALVKKGEGTLKAVGRSFINKLLLRSFLEDMHNNGNIKVQNIILDFARYVSGSEFCIMHQDEPPKSFADAQHLVIDLAKDWKHDHNLEGSALPLRTLIFNTDGLERHVGCLDFRMKWLRFLKIGPSGMSDWQQKLRDLKLLRVLSINETSVDEVPESLYELYGLIKLDLSSTGISSLSEQIGNLRNLRAIDLHDTNIQRIPDSICRLTALEELDLTRCKHISELPGGIGVLISLRLLCLIGTSVKCMSPESCKLPKLIILQQREEGQSA